LLSFGLGRVLGKCGNNAERYTQIEAILKGRATSVAFGNPLSIWTKLQFANRAWNVDASKATIGVSAGEDLARGYQRCIRSEDQNMPIH
jgi:hypothetical protein